MYRLLVDLFQPYTILILWICWAVFRCGERGDPKRRLWPLVVPLLILAAPCYLTNALNSGLLPPDYMAMTEQVAGRPIPDVVTLSMRIQRG